MLVRESFAPFPARSPAAARRYVHSVLLAYERRALLDDALLLVSEVVTNALTHGGADEAGIRVRLSGDVLRVEVSDPGAMWTAPRRAGNPVAGGSYGLGIIESIADTWGVDDLGDAGKAVWFELAAPAA